MRKTSAACGPTKNQENNKTVTRAAPLVHLIENDTQA